MDVNIRLAARSVRDILEVLGVPPLNCSAEPTHDSVDTDWSMEPELLQILLALISHVKPAVTVELGTYEGRTAATLAGLIRVLGCGRVFTVDDFRSIEATYSQTRFRRLDLESTITQIHSSTVDAFVAWGREPVDLLLIDAGHDFLSSCVDFALWSRLLTHDGWIVIHDTKTRLLRRFPEDYIHPLDYYSVLDVTDLEERPSGRSWQGVAFVRHRNRTWAQHALCPIHSVIGRTIWAGRL
jgi:predicted O-methyltransferase YrrM